MTKQTPLRALLQRTARRFAGRPRRVPARSLQAAPVVSIRARARTHVRPRAAAFMLAGLVFFFGLALNLSHPAQTAAATSDTINFQARLEARSGAIVPDGTYNVEFKLYNVSSGGSALWTEDYLNSAGHGITVANGYLTANLGSITAFPSIDWSQQLWLTLNIGGTTSSPSWDGEMSPRLLLTAIPYAFQAGSATQLSTTDGSYTSQLTFTTPTANDSITLPDASGIVCLEASSSCGFALSSSSGSYIWNQTASPQTAGFNINGNGTIGGTLTLGSSSASEPLRVAGADGDLVELNPGTLSVSDSAYIAFNGQAQFGYDGTTTNASIQAVSGKGFEVMVNGNTASSFNISSAGAATFQNATDSTTAFQIQNSNSNDLLSADTSDMQLNVGTLVSNQTISVQGPDGGSVLIGAVANSGTGSNAMTFSGGVITDATRSEDIQGDGEQPPTGGMGIWQATTNLINNGGFESNTTGWGKRDGSGTITYSQSGAAAKFGSKSVTLTNTTAGEDGYLDTSVSVNASTAYTVSAWVNVPIFIAAANLNRGLGIACNTGSGYDVSSFTPITSSTNGWVRLTSTITTSAADTSCQIRLYAPQGTLYWDGVQLEQNPIATPYVDTSGSTASRSAAYVAAPSSNLNGTEGWVSERVRMGWSSSQDPGSNEYLFSWGTSGADWIALRHDLGQGAAMNMVMQVGGTTIVNTSVPVTWSAGQTLTLTLSWTSTTMSLSINGSTFTASTKSSSPAPTPSTFQIGDYTPTYGQFDGDVLWTAAGTGTLTNADAASLNALGNSDPSISGLTTMDSAATPTFAWNGEGQAYTGTNNTPTLQSGITLDDTSIYHSGNGSIAIQGGVNSTTAFQVQDASSNSVLNVDTTDHEVVVRAQSSQSTDAFEVQNSSGTKEVSVDSTGQLTTWASGTQIGLQASGSVVRVTPGAGTYTARLGVGTLTATTVGEQIQGVASQSADLLELQNSSGTVLSHFDDNGDLIVGSSAASSGGVLTVGTNTTSASGGLYFGTDTNLYRGGSGELQTNSWLNIQPTNNPNEELNIGGTISNSTSYENAEVIQPTFTPTASVSTWRGLWSGPTANPGSGVTLSNFIGIASQLTTGSGAGAITNLQGFVASSPDYGSILPSAATGLAVYNYGASGVGTAIGVDIQAQTGATTDIGLRIAKATTYSLQLSDTSGTAAGGIEFGTDTDLYRSQSSELETDGVFAAAGNIIVQSGGSPQVSIGNFGTGGTAGIGFGSANDTNLYRSAANTLKTDDNLVVGTLGSSGTSVLCEAGGQLETCGSSAGSGSYIWNQTASTQTAGFKISGNGTIGGQLAVNTTTTATSGATIGSVLQETASPTSASTGNYYADEDNSIYNGTASTTGLVIGSWDVGQQGAGSGVNVANVYGTYGQADVYGAGTVSNLIGSLGLAEINSTGGGNVTNAVGLQAQVENQSTANAVITTAYGLQVHTPVASSTGTITTDYGVYISPQATTGVGTAYGLYQNGSSDLNVLDGATTINNTLTVSGAISTSSYYEISGTAVLQSPGNNNLFVGSSGNATLTGGANTAEGVATFTADTTGYDNTVQGYHALLDNTTGYDNVAVGETALQNNTSGYYDTALGYEALAEGTAGLQNTATGAAALFDNTGNNNTANGFAALEDNTSGGGNTALGATALRNNTGGNNTAVGYQALLDNTSGGNNVALGVNALLDNTTGSENTAVGFGALDNNTGNNNTAQGYDALLDNTSGPQNAALGVQALQANTTGGYNTALGVNALQDNTTGSNNAALGNLAGLTSTSGNANTTGSYNTFIGYNSGPGVVSSSSLQAAAAIGAYSVVDESNALVLGCVYNINSCPATTSIGIGTASPSGILQVTGGIINLNTSGSAATNIGTGSTGTVSIGSSSAGAISVTSGSTVNILGTTASVDTGSGGFVTIGTSANNKTVNIGAVGSTTATTSLNIADTTGNAAQTVKIGSTTSSGSTTTIQGGTGSSAVSIQAGSGGTILMGTASANTIDLGASGSASSASTLNLVSTTGSATEAVNIGSATNAANVSLNVYGATSIKDNSTTAFQVQNAGGTTTLFSADTIDSVVNVNNAELNVANTGVPATPTLTAGANTGGSLSGSPSTTYYYQVTAVTGGVESPASDEQSFNGSSFTPIAAPSSAPTATDSGSSSGNGIPICDSADGCSYAVAFVTANGQTTLGPSSIPILNVSGDSINLTGIPTGPTGTTARYIYVESYGYFGDYNFHLALQIFNNTATTATDNGDIWILPAPTLDTATTNTNELSLSWPAVPGASSYKIYRGTSSGGENTLVGTSSTNSYTDTGGGSAGTPPAATATPTANVVGTTLIQPASNVTTPFAINNAGDRNLLSVNASSSTVTLGTPDTAGTSGTGGTLGTPSVPESPGYATGSGGTGTPGSWTPTTSLGTGCGSAVYGASSVAYNGYIYIIGGDPTQTTVTNTVCYASLNASTGAVGTWQAISASLPDDLAGATAVVSNGYLYVLGGDDCYMSGGECPTGNVYYAQLQSNGNITSWNTASNPLANVVTGLADATSVVNNGYIYEIGGDDCDGPGGGCQPDEVWYAQLNPSTGDVGPWTSTNAPPSGYQDYATAVVNNNYVYFLGGSSNDLCSGSPTANVYYASINTSTGALSAWSSTSALPETASGSTAIAWGGYVYNTEGHYNSTCTGGTGSPYTDHGQFQSGGTLATQGTTGTAYAAYWAAGTAYNGYMYKLGGTTTGTTALSTVTYASVTGTETLTGGSGGSSGSQGTAGTPGTAGTTGLGVSLDVNGSANVQSTTNSTNAFEVQNASGLAQLTVDTTNNAVDIGTTSNPTSLNVYGATLIKDESSSTAATAFQVQNTGGTTLLGVNASNNTIFSTLASGNNAFTLTTHATYSSGNLLVLENNGTSKFSVDYNGDVSASGNLSVSGTITSSTRPTTYALTLENGYTNYSGGWTSATCYVDASGIVHLQGMIDNGGGNFTIGQAFAVLPSQCPAPSSYHIFASEDASNGNSCYLTGWVYVEGNTFFIGNGASCNPVSWISLDGISYHP